MKPKARNNKILIQEIENEVLIYDLTNNKVFNLNKTAALVWRNCNGTNSVEIISENTNFPVNLILLTIDELQKYNLFEEEFVTNLPTDKSNRRKLLMQFAATAFALPAIITLVAPKSINAQSGLVCKRNNGCDCPGGTQTTRLDFIGATCDVPSTNCDPECTCTVIDLIDQPPLPPRPTLQCL